VPSGTRVLIAPLTGVGRDYPLSIEKLAPVLSWYVVADWREGCERCIEVLRYGGMGHTMSIHSKAEDVILQFGLKKPAFRICVNTPTTHGSIGLTTGLDPAMTLGCGGWGGNITSDNISPRHLLNIKRLAYEVRPAVVTHPTAPAAADVPRPTPAARPVREGIPVEVLAARIDQFLATRGFAHASAAPSGTPPAPATPAVAPAVAPVVPVHDAVGPVSVPADFVCEEDVREAIRGGRKLVIGEKTILTPSARDLGESQKVFLQAG
jgi:acetaldehyde dehydrogenase (acetylating)